MTRALSYSSTPDWPAIQLFAKLTVRRFYAEMGWKLHAKTTRS